MADFEFLGNHQNDQKLSKMDKMTKMTKNGPKMTKQMVQFCKKKWGQIFGESAKFYCRNAHFTDLNIYLRNQIPSVFPLG